jgi:hypothetical protein
MSRNTIILLIYHRLDSKVKDKTTSCKATGLLGSQILQRLFGISLKMKENFCRSFADIVTFNWRRSKHVT